MKTIIKFILLSFLILTLLAIYLWFGVINQKINVDNANTKIYIKEGDNYESLLTQLKDKKIIESFFWFEKMAQFKKLPKHIYEGRYSLKEGMTYNELINFFRSAQIDVVKVDFHSIRTKEELAERVSTQIEASKESIIGILNDENYLKKFDLNKYNSLTLFLPNTYEMYWNTNATEFVERMAKEYKKFWNTDRKEKAKAAKLSPPEIYILASIVQAEQSKVLEEWPVIAGLYLNRLHCGMPLQSDPTVVFALGDFTKNRVYHNDLEVESPYNTYRHTGLPPGPIYLARPDVIDAVLNASQHEYLFMCASGDGSFRHNFARSYSQHLQNARAYTNKLNQQGIK